MSRADRAQGAPENRPPSIDRMAGWPALASLVEGAGRPLVVEALRAWVEAKRGTPDVADELACARWCADRLAGLMQPSQRRVFNLTGTVLHTNLGRAVLAEEAIAAAVELGVFEALPGTSEEIAARCELHEERTERLLRALGELSLVTMEGPQWRRTPRGEYLRRDHPLTLAGAASEYAQHFSAMPAIFFHASHEKSATRI